jgi:hypothetical protein
MMAWFSGWGPIDRMGAGGSVRCQCALRGRRVEPLESVSLLLDGVLMLEEGDVKVIVVCIWNINESLNNFLKVSCTLEGSRGLSYV